MERIGFLTLFLSIFLMTARTQEDLGRQLWRSSNLGWDVYRSDDYRWRNIFIGSGYFYPLKALPKFSIYGGLNINWSKYTLYSNGKYALVKNNSKLKTTSLSIPIHANYQVFKVKGFGFNVYAGPVFEVITASKLDNYFFSSVNRFQTGWTVGSRFQFFYLFRARIAYSYYPISLLTNHDMPRNALTFSVGF